MEEKKCSCKSNLEYNNIPILIGGIIVYELAIIIILLAFILWDLDKVSEQPDNTVVKSTEEEK